MTPLPPLPPPRGTRGRKIALSSLGALGTVALVLGGLAVRGSFVADPAGEKDSAIFDAYSGFNPDARLTEEALAETDSDSVFWTMFHNQTTQRVVWINHKFYRSYEEFQQDPIGWPGTVRQSRIDYADQRITVGDTDYEVSDSPEAYVDDQSRCIDGELYAVTDDERGWERDAIADSTCQMRSMHSGSGDGIAPGGLTDEQADNYFHYIQTSRETNPVSVGEPGLVSHNGQRYVALPVTITPVRGANGHAGMSVFLDGMHHIGVHPGTHLYGSFGAGGSGAEITYYVDPRTTLPAYMTIRETSGREKNGTPKDSDNNGFKRVQYHYPRQWQPYRLDDPKTLEPITLDWPPTIP